MDSVQDLHGWSVMYLRYLRAFQRLNVASSHIIQAQKRKDLRRCLECCMARMLEIRAHLVSPHAFSQHCPARSQHGCQPSSAALSGPVKAESGALCRSLSTRGWTL